MSDWIAICGEEGEAPIEIETEEDGMLLLDSVTAHFPGTTTLKYWNQGRTAMRGVKCIDGKMAPPTGGWDQASLYLCVNPLKEEQTAKRKADSSDDNQPAKKRDFDPQATIDLVLLGLNPQTTERGIREYFEEKGEVSMIEMKKSKDANVGYAFIRFGDKNVEKEMLKEKHMIGGRQAYLKIPNSQQGERSERKVYVSYHTQDLTVFDFREHFEKFGGVEDVFIPTPWRHYCFVTFTEKRVAQSLIGKEHVLKGVSLLIKSLHQNKDKDRMQDKQSMDMMSQYGMGGMQNNMGFMPYGMGAMGGMGSMGGMNSMNGMGGMAGMRFGMFGDNERQSGNSMGGRSGMGWTDDEGQNGRGWSFGPNSQNRGQSFGGQSSNKGFGGDRRN